MMPAVTVKANASPNGFPIASAHSPTRVESEFPKPTVGRLRASILMTATSVLGSVPTTFAVNSRLSRSEEHTSELQSLAYLVCRLLLEKKKKQERNRVR